MTSFNVKSVLLGMGLGMIITALISMLYISGRNMEVGKYDKLLDNKIGSKELIAEKQDLQEQDIRSNKRIENLEETILEVSENEKQENETNETEVVLNEEVLVEKKIVAFRIYRGDTTERVSKRLEDKGLIQNREQFLDKIHNSGLEGRLQVKRYTFYEGISEDEIITLITSY